MSTQSSRATVLGIGGASGAVGAGLHTYSNTTTTSGLSGYGSSTGGLMAQTVSPISTLNIQALTGINNDWLNHISNPNVKKYEVIETNEDIITLGVTAHRLQKTSAIFHRLLDEDLFKKITNEDREKSKEIKDYYSKKVMMWKLKGNGNLSPYREDMNKLIHSNGMMFKENMLGIAYWLPEFYEYDQKVDAVKEQVSTNQNFSELDKQGRPGVLKLSVELEPINRILRKSKRVKSFEYWMRDTKLNAGVVLHLEEKNQLQHLWDYIFSNEKVLKIQGNYVRRHRDGFEYFAINNWELDRS